MSLSSKSFGLSVDADLELTINGHSSSLTGQGNQLQFLLGSEEVLAELIGSGAHITGRLAETLNDLGLTLTVINENRPLLKMGYTISSRISKVFTGSAHIVPADLSSLLTLWRNYWQYRRKYSYETG